MPQDDERYALIADGRTAALVGRDGSIDWFCWPRFDSSAAFAALLGGPEHGRWRIAPQARALEIRRRYREDTLVLETDFESPEGAVRLIDFMSRRAGVTDLIRIVIGQAGRVRMHMDLSLRFDFGASVPWVSRHEDGSLKALAGPNRAILRTPVALRGEGLTTIADFTVDRGDTIPFVLSYTPSHEPIPAAIDALAALEETEHEWRAWIRSCSYQGCFAKEVRRALVTIKGLSYAPTGALVAAPTIAPIPSPLGSPSADGRAAELSEACTTLLALVGTNHTEEATAWVSWLGRAVAGSPEQIQNSYSVTGAPRVAHWVANDQPGPARARLDRLDPLEAARSPLDVLGEIIGTFHEARRSGLRLSPEVWSMERAQIDHLERIWANADAELLSGPSILDAGTYSKAMAWFALDRALRDIDEFGLPGPVKRWSRLRSEVHADVCRTGYNAKRATFVRAAASEELDPRLLRLGPLGFLPVSDARMRGTIAALEEEILGRADGPSSEPRAGFWLAENWILQGRVDEAQQLIEELLERRNDVGLLADGRTRLGRGTGHHFPALCCQVALVNSILRLEGAHQKARTQFETLQGPIRTPERTRQSAARNA